MVRPYFVEHYGDLASVLGLIIALVGFRLTLRDVRKAERAAEEARKAARESLARLKSQVLAYEIGSALQFAREVDIACQVMNWSGAVHRANDARMQLARLSENLRLGDDDRKAMSAAGALLNDFVLYLQGKREKTPEKGLARRKSANLQTVIVVLGQLQAKIEASIMES